jgi:hypothetical protein
MSSYSAFGSRSMFFFFCLTEGKLSCVAVRKFDPLPMLNISTQGTLKLSWWARDSTISFGLLLTCYDWLLVVVIWFLMFALNHDAHFTILISLRALSCIHDLLQYQCTLHSWVSCYCCPVFAWIKNVLFQFLLLIGTIAFLWNWSLTTPSMPISPTGKKLFDDQLLMPHAML